MVSLNWLVVFEDLLLTQRLSLLYFEGLSVELVLGAPGKHGALRCCQPYQCFLLAKAPLPFDNEVVRAIRMVALPNIVDVVLVIEFDQIDPASAIVFITLVALVILAVYDQIQHPKVPLGHEHPNLLVVGQLRVQRSDKLNILITGGVYLFLREWRLNSDGVHSTIQFI